MEKTAIDSMERAVEHNIDRLIEIAQKMVNDIHYSTGCSDELLGNRLIKISVFNMIARKLGIEPIWKSVGMIYRKEYEASPWKLLSDTNKGLSDDVLEFSEDQFGLFWISEDPGEEGDNSEEEFVKDIMEDYLPREDICVEYFYGDSMGIMQLPKIPEGRNETELEKKIRRGIMEGIIDEEHLIAKDGSSIIIFQNEYSSNVISFDFTRFAGISFLGMLYQYFSEKGQRE